MDGERPSETCKVLFQNKINLRCCASGWFYYRKAQGVGEQTAGRNKRECTGIIRRILHRTIRRSMICTLTCLQNHVISWRRA